MRNCFKTQGGWLLRNNAWFWPLDTRTCTRTWMLTSALPHELTHIYSQMYWRQAKHGEQPCACCTEYRIKTLTKESVTLFMLSFSCFLKISKFCPDWKKLFYMHSMLKKNWVGIVKWYKYRGSSKKIKNSITVWSSNPVTRTRSKSGRGSLCLHTLVQKHVS